MSSVQGLLGVSTKPSRGAFTESLCSYLLRMRGLAVTRLNRAGADFDVGGFGRVDVKARLRLEDEDGCQFVRIPRRYELPNTSYLYVIYFRNRVEFVCEHERSIVSALSFTVAWSVVQEFYSTAYMHVGLKESPTNHDEILTIKKTLKEWVKHAWGKNLRVIHREGRVVQEAMSRRGWGPDTFFQKRADQSGIDIVALLYFDGARVYSVFAYPVADMAEIRWQEKPVGPNKAGVTIFHPLELDSKFEFRDIEDFKDQFPNRFQLGSRPLKNHP